MNKEAEHARYSQYQCFHLSSGVFLCLSDNPEVNSIVIKQLAGHFKKFSHLEEINVF